MYTYYTQADKLKYLRAECRKYGFTFRKSNAYFNGKPLYHIVSRRNGYTVSSGHTIASAYDADMNCSFISQLGD